MRNLHNIYSPFFDVLQLDKIRLLWRALTSAQLMIMFEYRMIQHEPLTNFSEQTSPAIGKRVS